MTQQETYQNTLLPEGMTYEEARSILLGWHELIKNDLDTNIALKKISCVVSSYEDSSLFETLIRTPETFLVYERVKLLGKALKEEGGFSDIDTNTQNSPMVELDDTVDTNTAPIKEELVVAQENAKQIPSKNQRVHSKGVRHIYNPTYTPSDRKFSMLPLRFFLNEEGNFETLFWVKCLYLLNRWRPFDKDGNPTTAGVRDDCGQNTELNIQLEFVWERIKEVDVDDRLLPKYISKSGPVDIGNKIVPNILKIEEEVCVFLIDDLFNGTKSTSTLILKSLIKFHQITEYEQLVYWAKNHNLLSLYRRNIKREWKKLTTQLTSTEEGLK